MDSRTLNDIPAFPCWTDDGAEWLWVCSKESCLRRGHRVERRFLWDLCESCGCTSERPTPMPKLLPRELEPTHGQGGRVRMTSMNVHTLAAMNAVLTRKRELLDDADAAESAASSWNDRIPMGARVTLRERPSAPSFETRTRSEAFVTCETFAVVLLEGLDFPPLIARITTDHETTYEAST